MNEQFLSEIREKLRDPQLEMQPLIMGGNSRLQIIKSPQHGDLVLKRYVDDGRKRLENEYAAFEFLFANGLQVPQPQCAVVRENYAIYKLLAGHRILSTELSISLIDNLLDFLRRLHDLRAIPSAFGLASEGCLSPVEVVDVVKRRRSRFCSIEHSELQSFLIGSFDPLAENLCALFRQQCGADYQQSLLKKDQTLSPSDFGLHNMLLDDEGRLGFVDFEYFGWDDPAKLIADFLWHPAMVLSIECKRQFVAGSQRIYGAPCHERWRRSHPLHGLKWVLLILNEFIDEDWQRRQFAGEQRKRKECLTQQLAKARLMLRRIEIEGKRNPYVD